MFKFTKALIEGRKVEDKETKKNLKEIEEYCQLFGKFSTGVTHFISLILVFVILIDQFNITIVKDIVAIEPNYLLGMVFGSLLFFFLSGIEMRLHGDFVQRLLKKIRIDISKRINQHDYEIPVKEVTIDTLGVAIVNLIGKYFLPVFIAIGSIFSLFGKRMTVIVIFGSFLMVLFFSYRRQIRNQMLIDLKNLYISVQGRNNQGVDPKYIGMLTSIIGQKQQAYSSDSISQLLLLFAVAMSCSQYFIEHADLLNKIFSRVINTQTNDKETK